MWVGWLISHHICCSVWCEKLIKWLEKTAMFNTLVKQFSIVKWIIMCDTIWVLTSFLKVSQLRHASDGEEVSGQLSCNMKLLKGKCLMYRHVRKNPYPTKWAIKLFWSTYFRMQFRFIRITKVIYSILIFFAPSDSRSSSSCISAKYCSIITNHTSMESLFIQLSDDV